jgi:diguanylate cyclase (GGDEF)-like protein
VRELSRRDALTGLYNRRYLDEQLPRLFAEQREAAPLSILMADLDDFKDINDRYRHQTGDRVLQEVARIFDASTPGSGAFVVRYGGEEFALLLPGAPVDEARRLAQKLCRSVRETAWGQLAEGLTVTVSVGVADGLGLAHPEDLLLRADHAMYAAKRAGKDRVRRFRRGGKRERL